MPHPPPSLHAAHSSGRRSPPGGRCRWQRHKPWDTALCSRPLPCHSAAPAPLGLAWREITKGHLEEAGVGFTGCAAGGWGQPEQATLASTHTVHPKGPSRGLLPRNGCQRPYPGAHPAPALQWGSCPLTPRLLILTGPRDPSEPGSSPGPGTHRPGSGLSRPHMLKERLSSFLIVTGPRTLRPPGVPDSVTPSPLCS